MRCVHCLKEIVKEKGAKTMDHVFPRQWYTDNTPEKIQRPTVPSCKSCNNKLGAIEEVLFVKLALCTNPAKAEASGIHKKLRKSFEKKKSLIKEIVESATPYKPGAGYFPGLGPNPHFPLEKQRTILMPETELLAVTKKIVRGLENYYNERYIEKPYKLEIHYVKEGADLLDIEHYFKIQLPITYGPGFIVERAAASDDPKSVMYRITIWGTFKYYATIMPYQNKKGSKP